MIGRYRDLSIYQEIFQSSDFYRIMVGGGLIPIGYLLSRTDFSAPAGNLPSGVVLFSGFLLVSAIVNGLPIIVGALKGIVRRRVNVDELVSIAIIACLLNGNFFEAAMVSFIMVLGSFIEEAVSDRARSAIERLVKATPRSALIEVDGRRQVRDIEAVNIGDIAIVQAGETIPVDGRIVDGAGTIDEALLTGESLPVFKGEGDGVSAGTLNIDGYLRLRVERTGEDATIGRIVDLVHQAETSKVDSARIVDRYAGYFTPAVIAIALVTYLATRDASRAIAVLVVGCPCSFLLAGPVAAVAAVGRAAKAGIMVKGGSHLETLARATVFFFDKTGTLTTGTPRITAIRPATGLDEAGLIELAAAVERGSTHPLARVIGERARQLAADRLTAVDITVIPGYGVKGMVDDRAVSVFPSVSDRGTGETSVRITVDGRLAGEIDLLDGLRPVVPEALHRLRTLGADRIAILSGDAAGAVERIADAAGITDWHHRLTPEEKLRKIQQAEGRGVVFVGDGMNDAPSLKAAAVGIAMGQRGSEMALSTADIVLMNDLVERLPFLVRLSRKMTRTIRVNIALSVGINLVALALGTMGLLSPIMGAVTHNIGSLLVVLLAASITFTKDPSRRRR